MTAKNQGITRTIRANPPSLRRGAGLLQLIDLHQLVPEPWAAWRPLVIDGLCFFLERLPAPRLASIMADQLSLAADTDSGQRLAHLFAQCPTLHKLGQVLARQRALPLELRRALQTLESMPAAAAMSEVLATIRDELGDPPLEIARQALAEGSVAVVIPFTYREGGEERHGVFKVLKPTVIERLDDELAVLTELEDFLEQRSQALGLPALDYRGTLGTVQRLLRHEVHFENEQRHLRAAAAFYAAEPRLWVPRLLPWCTRRLTAMERVFGIKVTDTALPLAARRTLADTLVATLLGQPFWNPSEAALFHGDLHAGNLLLAADGRLAVLDWSLTARLSKNQRESLIAIALGGALLDAQKVREGASMLGSLAENDRALTAATEQALDRLVSSGGLPGFDWLLQLLDDVALRTAAGFPEDFVLFRKSWLSLSGVLGDLAQQPSPDIELLGLGLQRFVAEWPARLRAAPTETGFSTHVSNADLLQVWSSPLLVSLRYWRRRWGRSKP